MKNHSNSEKHFNFRNKYIFSSVNENNFYSLDLQTSHQKIINKKRNRDENKSTIIEKINKLESNQNLTNNKLDIILSILTSKLLGKNEFQISHYDLCLIPKNKKEKEKEEMEIKEDNDVNINDEFEEEHIYQINKKPHFNSNNLDRKNLINEIFDKSTNINNISSGNGNLKEMINDFLYQKKKKKTINENNTQNNEKNILENDIEDNNKNIENENINDEEKDKIKDEKNIKNNLIMNPEKKSLDLNKYKFESDIVDKEEEKQISEKDKLENININEEINNKENNENNLITEESKKFENSQCDSVSVNSNSSNSSAKKSNKSSAKKIRGFNFRNKINIKKYNGNKSERSSSQNNSSDEK